MNFRVPQFIDVEDKLFGPFTFSEFAYLIGGGGLIFIIYKIMPLWIAIFFIIPTAVLSGLLVFYKINNKPFIFYLQAGLTYYMSSKLYVWKQRLVDHNTEEKINTVPQKRDVIPVMNPNKLKDVSWALDIQTKEE